jgi:hypothetical protein
MAKKPLEDRILGFLGIWDLSSLQGLLSELYEIYALYDVDEDDDWLEKDVGGNNVRNVRLIRTVYLLSRLGDLYAGKLCRSSSQYKNLWKELEDVKESNVNASNVPGNDNNGHGQ